MKKLYTLFFAVCFFNCLNAQFVDIPNDEFRNFLIAKYPACFNGSNQMDTQCSAITTEDSLQFHGLGYIFTPFLISLDMEGIEYFTSLKYLDCSGNFINSSPALPASLLYLKCDHINYGNDPAYFFSMPATLQHINYSNNFLGSGNFPSGVKYLDISYNAYFNLPSLPANLDTLLCNDQDFDSNPILTTIASLPSSLRYLDCSHNGLTTLPALPTNLTYLKCSSQYYEADPATRVPSLTALPDPLPLTLQSLICNNNHLTSLPSLPDGLGYLDCSGNKFDYDDGIWVFHFPGISCLPHLPDGLQYLGIDGNNINCLPNLPAAVSTSLPVCTLLNNSNGCVLTPVISGNIFYDNNSNGTQEAGELPRANVSVSLDNGQTGFTDVNGHYAIRVMNTGTYILTVAAPPYYTAAPPSFSYTFNNYDTTVTGLVALQPAILVDSMKITITPLNTARPAQPLSYRVSYENVGTTVVNAAITVNYDNARLTFTGSSNPLVVNNGNYLKLNLTNLTPGQQDQFTSLFTVSPSANINDTIFAKVIDSSGMAVAVDSTYSVVLSSFDPNYKQATPSLSTSQVNNGDYINYLIGFQNTGTDTAFNIILTDTLSAMLQANTVQIIEASHQCMITQSGNKLAFEFLNIKLPDMTTNEAASHGYVRFRIKAQPFLSAGTLVPNKGFIYFDYNAAVPTATVNTTIFQGSIVVPLKLSGFTAKKQNQAVQLNWTTEQEINSKEFIVERSADQNKWNQLLRVNAAGNSSQKLNYTATDFNPAKGINYYRLKQVDLDGRFTYSEIRSVYFGNDMNFVLAPNPAKDKLTVYLPGNTALVSVNIYNSNDQLVKTISSAEETIPVNVGNLSKGVYTVKIRGKNINEVRKLLLY